MPVHVVEGASETVPGLAMDTHEIITRWLRGEPLDDMRRLMNYDDNTFANDDDSFEVHPANRIGLDLSDVDEMKRELDSYLENAKTINENANKGVGIKPPTLIPQPPADPPADPPAN